MATNFMSFLNINTTLTPANTAGSESKNVLLIGQRITNGVLTLSTNGFAQPNYYVPFLLPAFQNGDAALNWLTNYGLVSTTGVAFTLGLPAPDVVTKIGSVTQVTWNTIPTNFIALTGFALSGTLSQLSVNAAVRSAQIIAGTAVMTVTGAPAFVEAGDSGAVMTLAGINNIPYPDPNASDPIALMVWDFYQTYLSASSSAEGSPAAYISILSDRDSTVNADLAPINLVAPVSVTAPDAGFQTLTYPATAGGLGYLPTTAYGNTIVSQSVNLPTSSTGFVYFADSLFISGSAAGAGLSHSTNGAVWTASNITTGTFTSAFYNGTIFAASSTVGLYHSADGLTWVVSNITTGSFTSVQYAGGIWVATSTDGIYHSADALTWTLATGAATGIFNQAAYGAGKWIATCSADLYSSADGITWTALTFSPDGFHAVAYADGLFVVGSDGSGTDGIAYSPDGVTFTASNIAVNSYKQIAYNNGQWAAASDAGIYYSANGLTWTLASGTSANSYTAFTFANALWVVTSDAGIYTSTDSVTWTASNIATGSYVSATNGTSLFVAAGTTGIVTSATGTVWSTNNIATGVYQGFGVSGSNVILSVQNTAGVFNATSAVSIVIDNTISAFDYLDGIDLHSAVNQFPVNNLDDINVAQASFFQGVAGLNQDNQVLNNHYFTYGFSGNITSLPSNAANLPAPNKNIYALVTYPYVQKFGDVPYENTAGNVAGGRLASAVAYMVANGDAPFPALMNARINHLPVSSVASTTSYSSAAGGTGNIAVEQGWLPLAPDNAGRVRILQSNTTMITLPNTTVPDVEFRYTHIWDCVRWLKYQVAQLYLSISVLPNNAGSPTISPGFIRQFRTGIIGILTLGQNLGVLENVSLYEGLVTVVEDPLNPNQVDAYVPSQIIPQLNGANVDINVFSALYTFTTTNQ